MRSFLAAFLALFILSNAATAFGQNVLSTPLAAQTLWDETFDEEFDGDNSLSPNRSAHQLTHVVRTDWSSSKTQNGLIQLWVFLPHATGPPSA